MAIISSSEFGSETARQANLAATSQSPLGLGANTTGTVAQQTSWRTPRQGGGVTTPLSYSKRTRGTTYSWDDDTTTPKFEQGS